MEFLGEFYVCRVKTSEAWVIFWQNKKKLLGETTCVFSLVEFITNWLTDKWSINYLVLTLCIHLHYTRRLEIAFIVRIRFERNGKYHLLLCKQNGLVCFFFLCPPFAYLTSSCGIFTATNLEIFTFLLDWLWRSKVI